MLDDSNPLVLIESMKIVETLAIMRDPGLKGKYAK